MLSNVEKLNRNKKNTDYFGEFLAEQNKIFEKFKSIMAKKISGGCILSDF